MLPIHGKRLISVREIFAGPGGKDEGPPGAGLTFRERPPKNPIRSLPEGNRVLFLWLQPALLTRCARI